jgi:hypothetical protein
MQATATGQTKMANAGRVDAGSATVNGFSTPETVSPSRGGGGALLVGAIPRETLRLFARNARNLRVVRSALDAAMGVLHAFRGCLELLLGPRAYGTSNLGAG